MVPKLWVAQDCGVLAPGVFLIVTLTHPVAAEFRVLPAPKGRVVLRMAMFKVAGSGPGGPPAPGPGVPSPASQRILYLWGLELGVGVGSREGAGEA